MFSQPFPAPLPQIYPGYPFPEGLNNSSQPSAAYPASGTNPLAYHSRPHELPANPFVCLVLPDTNKRYILKSEDYQLMHTALLNLYIHDKFKDFCTSERINRLNQWVDDYCFVTSIYDSIGKKYEKIWQNITRRISEINFRIEEMINVIDNSEAIPQQNPADLSIFSGKFDLNLPPLDIHENLYNEFGRICQHMLLLMDIKNQYNLFFDRLTCLKISLCRNIVNFIG